MNDIIIKHIDIAVLTESWLSTDITDNEIAIPGYQLFRCDRTIGIHGGTLVYVKDCIAVTTVLCESQPLNENICLRLNDSPSTAIFCCYRSGYSSNDTNQDLISKLLHTAHRYKNLIILGDFNCPRIDWLNEVCLPGAEPVERAILETCVSIDSFQNVTFPTRNVHGQKPAILDLILTAGEVHISSIDHGPPYGKSDHDVVYFNAELDCARHPDYKKAVYNFHKADIDGINDNFSAVDWISLFAEISLDECCNMLVDITSTEVDKNVPKTCWHKYRIPLPSYVCQAIKLKRKAWRRYSKSRTATDYKNYVCHRNSSVALIRSHEKQYSMNVVKSKDLNKLYKYINVNKGKGFKIQSLSSKDSCTTVPVEIAELLNTTFCSVFTSDKCHCDISGPIEQINIDEFVVRKMLESLDPKKATGSDGISPKILNLCASSLAKPVSTIICRSLQTATVPDSWKMANIIPLFKKGKRDDPRNYRPISLLPVASKVCEKIVHQLLLEECDELGIIDVTQHGFTKGRSCLTNLLTSRNAWTAAVDKGIPVDVIYIDFSRAFDTVPHSELIKTLVRLGISVKLTRWISSYLSNRKQRVMIEGTFSRWEHITSGVPQGSVLGPILFCLFVSDMGLGLSSVLEKYADDTKIYRPITTQSESLVLQQDLNQIEKWCKDRRMTLNPDKCCVLHIGHNNSRANYSLCGQSLSAVDTVSDLGVVVSSDLSVTKQVDAVVAKANRFVGFIRRHLRFLDPSSIETIYKSYVRPLAEYCIQAWRPWLIKDVTRLEQVQRRVTKMVPEFRNLSYDDRRKRLNLPTVPERWTRGDNILAYQIFQQKCKLDVSEFFTLSTSTTRGHNFKLAKHQVKLEVRRNDFAFRTVNTWNALPANAVNSSTLNGFKAAIDRANEPSNL